VSRQRVALQHDGMANYPPILCDLSVPRANLIPCLAAKSCLLEFSCRCQVRPGPVSFSASGITSSRNVNGRRKKIIARCVVDLRVLPHIALEKNGRHRAWTYSWLKRRSALRESVSPGFTLVTPIPHFRSPCAGRIFSRHSHWRHSVAAEHFPLFELRVTLDRRQKYLFCMRATLNGNRPAVLIT